MPERIFCLTFTNRAADEMASRVRKHYPAVASKITVKTFHGLCGWMLRIEARAIGLPRDFMIFDDADSIELLGLGELWTRRPMRVSVPRFEQ